jgi:hypothetical protein
VTVADLRVNVEASDLVMGLSDNGIPAHLESKGRDSTLTIAATSYEVLGGTIEVGCNEQGYTRLTARLSL